MSGFAERLSQRHKMFKKGVDAEVTRRKLENESVQLRKQARDETLQKKRMMMDVSPLPMPDIGGITLETILQLKQRLLSDNSQDQFDAAVQVRVILSSQTEAPIQEVIETGMVPSLVQLMSAVDWPEMQLEATWALSNIASGTTEQTAVVVQDGALPVLVHSLQSFHEDVCEQAVWALGNIAGDSVRFRDLVLQSGALDSIVELLLYTPNSSIVRTAAWALSNLCRGKPLVPLECAVRALDALAVLLFSDDEEVLAHACWALSYLTDSATIYIDAVIQSNLTTQLVELLLHASPSVQRPALRAIGNIILGEEHQADVVLQSGALPPLSYLLSHPDKSIRKDACWAVSNIAAGTVCQIQELIDCGLIPQIVSLLQTGDFDIKKEALWTIANVASKGSAEQIEDLVIAECIEPLVDLLTIPDAQTLTISLEAINSVLNIGLQRQMEQGLDDNAFALIVEGADGLNKIEALQEAPSEEVYHRAMYILETYFALEDDVETNAIESGSGFQFGTTLPEGGFVFA